MTIDRATGQPFPRGALPSSRAKLLGAMPFKPFRAPPPQFGFFPKQLSYWGNNQFGDCVTAESAFAKACYSPEIFIDDQTVIDWARRHGVLNGAGLADVLDMMVNDGFRVGSQQYNEGQKAGVNYEDEGTLQAAIFSGPVKIAIDANALPQGAGNDQGWYSFGRGRYPNTDHCVSLPGYGPAGYLFQSIGVPTPSSVDPSKPAYALYTWKTIGVVDHDWLLGTCTEAWVRNPTTLGVPPLPGPTPIPPIPPVPPVPPLPGGPTFSGRIMGLIPFNGTVSMTGQVGLPPILPILLPIIKAACLMIESGEITNLPPWLLAVAKTVCAYLHQQKSRRTNLEMANF